MRKFTDQLQRTLFLPDEPLRIVSLVPSQTELLHYLGLEEKVVGITKFCVHPNNWFKAKTRIGGTKNIDLEKVRLLHPNLIIANKEENTKEDIENLEKIAPVWISDVRNLEDAYQMIHKIGELLDKSIQAGLLVDEIQRKMSLIQGMGKGKRALYVIWNDPIMVAASNTYIHEMMIHLGFENLAHEESRYPELTLSQLVQLSPDYLLLSSEPFPFKEKHLSFFQELLPNSKILLVDGEMFSWYGSGMLRAVSYFETWNHELS